MRSYAQILRVNFLGDLLFILFLAGILILMGFISADAYNASSFTVTNISSATIQPGAIRTAGLNILFPDPTDTTTTDATATTATGNTLVAFNTTTTFIDASSTDNGVYNDTELIVRDNDADGFVSSGDTVVTTRRTRGKILPFVASDKVCWRDGDGLDFDYTSATAFDALWWDSAGNCASFTSGTDIVLTSTSTDFFGASSTLFAAAGEQEMGYIDVDGNDAYTASRVASTTEPVIYTGTNAINWLEDSSASTTAVFFDSSTVATDGIRNIAGAAAWDETGTAADDMNAFGATYKFVDTDSSTNYTYNEDIYIDDDGSGLLRRDQLNAITIQNAGSAVATTDIAKIEVWQDDGNGSFSAAADTLLGAATYDSSNSWDLSALTTNYDAPSPIRVFVTFDMAAAPTGGRTIQLRIPVLSDANSSGGYNSGDEGIFLVGTNESPSDAAMTNSGTFSLGGASKCKSNTTPPSTPANFSVTSTGKSGELMVTWNNPSDSDFSYIIVYRSEIKGFIGSIAHYISGNSLSDVGLVNGRTYYYTLKAVDNCANESVATLTINGIPREEVVAPPKVEEKPPVVETPKEEVVTPLAITEKGPAGLVAGGNKVSASSIPSTASSIMEGNLIRGEDGVKVYVVKNGYVRWIQAPAIMGMYGHFQWLNVKQVSNMDLNKFYEASLIRADGDDKVYKVDSEGKKHWLNMTAQQFEAQGYKWDAIYVINKTELDWYGTGVEIKI